MMHRLARLMMHYLDVAALVFVAVLVGMWSLLAAAVLVAVVGLVWLAMARE